VTGLVLTYEFGFHLQFSEVEISIEFEEEVADLRVKIAIGAVWRCAYHLAILRHVIAPEVMARIGLAAQQTGP